MPEKIEQQLSQLNEQVLGLYRGGRFEQAVGFATQACKLAYRHFGKAHPDFANSLNNLASLYCSMGNYAAAEPLYRQALEIRRKALGEEHPDFATSLNNLAALYYSTSRYASAEPLYRQAVEVNRKAVGEEDPAFAQVLNNLASLYHSMGNYNAAEPLYRQALEIRRKALGEEHPDFATSLDRLAKLYLLMGNNLAAEPLVGQSLEALRGEGDPDFANNLNNWANCMKNLKLLNLRNYALAEPFFRKEVENKRKSLGEEHPEFATSLDNLALEYYSTRNYAAAEPLYRQALEIRRKALGEEHPDFAASLNHMADLQKSTGNYDGAEPLYRQALEIRRKALGEDHPSFAVSLNKLATLYYSMGNYAAAEPLYRQALEIRRKALGEDHPSFAASLNNLARLYKAVGDYDAAESLYRQALEIRRKALGEKHPDFAASLNNLALLYSAMDNYYEAGSLLSQALEVTRKVLGEDHLDFASCLDNVAGLCQQMGNHAGAEPRHRQALEIRRKALGEDHPSFAVSLNNLATLYCSMGNYAAAEPLYRQALDVKRKALGEDHPDFAAILNNLGSLCAATQREDEALALMEQAMVSDDRMIGQVFSFGSERQRMAYIDHIQSTFDAFLSLVVRHVSGNVGAVRTAADLVLRRKAIGAEALAAQRDAVLRGRYPVLEPKLKELTTLRMQIAQKTLAGPGAEGVEAHRNDLAGWNARKEQLETELARQIPEMNLEQKLRNAGRHAVALALPEGSVLVEFVRFNLRDLEVVDLGGGPAHYLAFVLNAGEPDNVQMIDLGEADPIDKMIATFRVRITGEAESRGTQDMEVVSGAAAARAQDGFDLRTLLFDPLQPALGGRKRLLVAPDGDLSRLPFEALPTGGGRRVIDEYNISYLGAGRDILRFRAPTSGLPGNPLVIADPDFDLSKELNAGAAPPPPPATAALGTTAAVGRQSRDLDWRAMHFDRLPKTRVEGERIAEMLGVRAWLEGTALKGRLKAAKSPRILHLATHGFFLPDQKRDPKERVKAKNRFAEVGPRGINGAALENPLLRSGLALAGANTGRRGGLLPPEAEDGIFTAEDVSGMDLLDTELVVLSACETGLGEVRTGEGVFGLRRSFVLAGARGLVMSLWMVPDQATQELMEDFYRRILDGRLIQSRAEALRAAQLALKEKYPDPGYWGAFIYQGDPFPPHREPSSHSQKNPSQGFPDHLQHSSEISH